MQQIQGGGGGIVGKTKKYQNLDTEGQKKNLEKSVLKTFKN